MISKVTVIVLVLSIKWSEISAQNNSGHLVERILFRTKCLEDLGCFYNGPPFYDPILRPISLLPIDLKDMHTKFFLYTSPTERILMERNEKWLDKSPYNKSAGVVFLIHGYLSDFNSSMFAVVQDLVPGLMNHTKSNIIFVDWTASDHGLYPQAVANARVVGAQVAQMIRFLQNKTDLDAKNVYLIGHSLGAHGAGWAGERIPNLGRITGLDPAGPYAHEGKPEIRLDPTDAQFVDIIHTNANNFVLKGLGITETSGNLDFYVNGGSMQPGCTLIPILQLPCNHVRAIDLYRASVDSTVKCKFIGTHCENYPKYLADKCDGNPTAIMGFYADKNKPTPTGWKFFLKTSGEYPYCIQN